jgi:hypothetical protein
VPFLVTSKKQLTFMFKLFAILLLLATASIAAAEEGPASRKQKVVVVLGAEGSADFGNQFRAWGERWRSVAEKGGAEFTLIGAEEIDATSDHDRLKSLFDKEQETAETAGQLWLILIGHGTFDGQVAKFNLRGPDISSGELGDWLSPVKRPIAVINCAAGSAPFINRLGGKDRIVVTSTRSGNELNYAHFGEYLAGAIDDSAADLDKDTQVSLLEAYLTACRRLDEFYAQESRLATEHPLIDDNGDGLGTPADWFRGLRATQRAKEGSTLDGTKAHQLHLVSSDKEQQIPDEIRQRRDALEVQLAALRGEKEKLNEDEYFARLEPLMVELAKIYQSIDSE